MDTAPDNLTCRVDVQSTKAYSPRQAGAGINTLNGKDVSNIYFTPTQKILNGAVCPWTQEMGNVSDGTECKEMRIISFAYFVQGKEKNMT